MLKHTSKLILCSKQQSSKAISTASILLSDSNKPVKKTHTQVKGYELLRNPSLYKVSENICNHLVKKVLSYFMIIIREWVFL